ncbi:MAG: hypothetical protein JO053_15765 [Acidobacteria bacterium]|nr:hypothetical protein [Acidobacteriota bacterium]
MRMIFAAAMLVIFALCGLAQDKDKIVRPSIETALPESARFQIVSPYRDGYSNNPLFRLDRYTGQVFRLTNCPKDAKIGSEKCWKEMLVIDLPHSGAVGQPRFQIFVGGTPQLILLLQVDTGATWQYGIDDPDKWYPLLDTVFLP